MYAVASAVNRYTNEFGPVRSLGTILQKARALWGEAHQGIAMPARASTFDRYQCHALLSTDTQSRGRREGVGV